MEDLERYCGEVDIRVNGSVYLDIRVGSGAKAQRVLRALLEG